MCWAAVSHHVAPRGHMIARARPRARCHSVVVHARLCGIPVRGGDPTGGEPVGMPLVVKRQRCRLW
jgi:hypothetical protein